MERATLPDGYIGKGGRVWPAVGVYRCDNVIDCKATHRSTGGGPVSQAGLLPHVTCEGCGNRAYLAAVEYGCSEDVEQAKSR